MIRYDGKEVVDGFQESFDRSITTITPKQMWWLVKVIKHCRGRCRSNAALNNYLNRSFPHLRFSDIDKVDERTGETYKGLEIQEK